MALRGVSVSGGALKEHKNMNTFRKEVCNLYLFAILLIIPVVTHVKYQDIIDIKSTLFLLIAGIFLACSFIILISSYRKVDLPFSKIKKVAALMSPLDRCLALFGLVILISSLTSRFSLRDTMLGEQAQLVGGLMLIALILNYFVLSRWADVTKKGYIYVFYLSSLFVVMVALLNRIMIDPLGMHRENMADTFGYMISTIGNVDYYCGYLSMILMFFAAYRADMDFNRKSAAVDFLLVCCYLSLWTARASSIFAGLAYGLPALLLMSLTSFARFRNLFWQGILAGVGGFAAHILHYRFPSIYSGLETEISGIFQLHYFWLFFGVVCLIVWLLLGNVLHSGRETNLMKLLFRLSKSLVVISAMLMAGLEGLILFYAPMQDYTGRIFIWNDIKQAFMAGTMREKMVGVGPGCLDLTLLRLGIHSKVDLYFLTAHNEVFEYWILTGIVGAAIYISLAICFFGSYYRSVLDDSVRKMDYFREMCCCAIVFAAFLGQGLTNGPYPVTVIIAFTFLALFRRYQIPDEE